MNATAAPSSTCRTIALGLRSLTAVAILVGLTGCGSGDDATSQDSAGVEDADTPATTPEVSQDPADDGSQGDVEMQDDPEMAATQVIDALNDEGDALLVPDLEYSFWGDASLLPPTVNYAVFCEREAQILDATFAALPASIGDSDVDPAYESLRSTRLAYTNEQQRICTEIVAEEANMPAEVLDEFLDVLDRERDLMILACTDALEAFSKYGVLNCSREPIATSAPDDFVLDTPPAEIMQRAEGGS